MNSKDEFPKDELPSEDEVLPEDEFPTDAFPEDELLPQHDLPPKTNSADAFPEDELLLEDGLLPEDELGCYVLGFSLPMRTRLMLGCTCICTLHPAFQDLLLQLCTHLMLRSRIFLCTCPHA